MTVQRNPAPKPIDSETNTYAGQRLKERRLSLNMSQTELGKAAGVSFQQIQKYERGTNRITIGMLNIFAEALRVPLTYFLTDGNMGSAMASNSKTAGYEVGPSKETRELLALFDNIDDPKLRKQVLELTKTLSKAKPRKK